jgi:gp39|nr:MAG TPA: bacteriocin [Caudoviricetes sp.]
MKYLIKYLGGHPEWTKPIEINLEVKDGCVKLAEIAWFRSDNIICLNKDDIISVDFEKSTSRSAGKTVAGALIGGVLTGGIGLLVGGAVGARKKNLSELYITYRYKEREFVIALQTKKYTEKIYAEINGLFI